MITYLNGRKLWIKGDKAYPIDELKTNFNQSKERDTELKGKLAELGSQIDELNEDRNRLVSEIQENTSIMKESGDLLAEIEISQCRPATASAIKAQMPKPEVKVTPNQVTNITIEEETAVEVPSELVEDAEPAVISTKIGGFNNRTLTDGNGRRPKRVIL